MNRAFYAVAALAAALAGCSDEGPRVPAHIEMIFGDRHSGTVGRVLELPLLVHVTDRWRDGYAGAVVHFTVTAGGGALNDEWESCAGVPGWGGPASTVSAETSSDGYAWVQMTPTTFGTTTVEAYVAGAPVSPATFLVEVDEPQVTLEIWAPYDEEVVAGPSFEVGGQPFVVLVVDEHGAPVPGVSIRWEVNSGGGDLDPWGPGCFAEEPVPGVLIARAGLDREPASGYSVVGFRATAFGTTTVTASVIGSTAAPATFTVDATAVLIVLGQIAPDEWKFIGPEHNSEVDVPVGATVEWVSQASSARIVSVSAPPGGTSFDSGDLTGNGRFQFVPDVAGTWRYVDQVTGEEGTLTAH